jgi:hypothetical protein
LFFNCLQTGHENEGAMPHQNGEFGAVNEPATAAYLLPFRQCRAARKGAPPRFSALRARC